jgi:hypothetical protein
MRDLDAQRQSLYDQDQQMTEPVEASGQGPHYAEKGEQVDTEEATDSEAETEYSDTNDDAPLSPDVRKFISQNADMLQQYRVLSKIGQGRLSERIVLMYRNI